MGVSKVERENEVCVSKVERECVGVSKVERENVWV